MGFLSKALGIARKLDPVGEFTEKKLGLPSSTSILGGIVGVDDRAKDATTEPVNTNPSLFAQNDLGAFLQNLLNQRGPQGTGGGQFDSNQFNQFLQQLVGRQFGGFNQQQQPQQRLQQPQPIIRRQRHAATQRNDNPHRFRDE